MTIKAAAMFITICAMSSAGCGENNTASATAPTSVTSPTSVSYITGFGPRGSATRFFTVSQAGVLTTTIVAVQPAMVIAFGLGIANGTDCILSTTETLAASSSAQISRAIDAGGYCVKAYDPGTVTEQISIEVTVTHP